jgi:hypothetical protein
MAAEMDADRRADREARQAAVRAEKAALAELEGQIADVCRQTDLVVRAALVAAGYRQHKRGEWRKPHGRTSAAD